jgi:hypothetical protein
VAGRGQPLPPPQNPPSPSSPPYPAHMPCVTHFMVTYVILHVLDRHGALSHLAVSVLFELVYKCLQAADRTSARKSMGEHQISLPRSQHHQQPYQPLPRHLVPSQEPPPDYPSINANTEETCNLAGIIHSLTVEWNSRDEHDKRRCADAAKMEWTLEIMAALCLQGPPERALGRVRASIKSLYRERSITNGRANLYLSTLCQVKSPHPTAPTSMRKPRKHATWLATRTTGDAAQRLLTWI